MFGLTILGAIHTAISLVALVSAVWALSQHKQILPSHRSGQVYLVSTLFTAATALGLYTHGKFGPPHALAVLTLLALAVGTVAAFTPVFGRASRYLQAVALSATLLFHMVPAVTETLTRLPAGAPLLASPEAAAFKPIYAALLLLFVVGLALQLRWLHSGAGALLRPVVARTA